MLKYSSKDNSTDTLNNVKKDKSDSIAAEQNGQINIYKIKSFYSPKFVICLKCGNKTPIDKNRCLSCDILINKIMLKNAKKLLKMMINFEDIGHFLNWVSVW